VRIPNLFLLFKSDIRFGRNSDFQTMRKFGKNSKFSHISCKKKTKLQDYSAPSAGHMSKLSTICS